MKERKCDKCSKVIPVNIDYYKVSLQKHIDKRQELKYAGDLCINCWKLVVGK